MLRLKGIHHITAITSSAEKIYNFFTYVLGLRLVKKTVNQDDINTYHLFFSDDIGSPGTDITFFDFKGVEKHQAGTDEIGRIGFRVNNDEALDYWIRRLNHYGVKFQRKDIFNKKAIFFEDFDNQEYSIYSDEHGHQSNSGIPWKKGPVPDDYAIIGLGTTFLKVQDLSRMKDVLVNYLGMRITDNNDNLSLFEMGEGGNGSSLIVEHLKGYRGIQGYGGVHHIAFIIEDKDELFEWINHLNKLGALHSGYVDRFYFKSLYTRLYPNILFEFATEGPGFIDEDEDYEILGETLALPPKLKDKRKYIESVIKPINTVRSNLKIEKEYLNE